MTKETALKQITSIREQIELSYPETGPGMIDTSIFYQIQELDLEVVGLYQEMISLDYHNAIVNYETPFPYLWNKLVLQAIEISQTYALQHVIKH